jgi:hypothetical protein
LRCLAIDRDGFLAGLRSEESVIFRRAGEPLLSAFTLWRSASIGLTTFARDGSLGRSIRSPFCFLRRSFLSAFSYSSPNFAGSNPRSLSDSVPPLGFVHHGALHNYAGGNEVLSHCFGGNDFVERLV